MNKPASYICENKNTAVTAQLISAVCFPFTDNTIPILKSEISSFQSSSVTVQAALSRKPGFS